MTTNGVLETDASTTSRDDHEKQHGAVWCTNQCLDCCERQFRIEIGPVEFVHWSRNRLFSRANSSDMAQSRRNAALRLGIRSERMARTTTRETLSHVYQEIFSAEKLEVEKLVILRPDRSSMNLERRKIIGIAFHNVHQPHSISTSLGNDHPHPLVGNIRSLSLSLICDRLYW